MKKIGNLLLSKCLHMNFLILIDFKYIIYIIRDREGVVNLINTLSNGEIEAIPINEDSNSLEISEKPIIDTGQISTSPSLEDEGVQENGIHIEGSDEKDLDKSEDFEDEREDNINEGDNIEEDIEGEDEITNDESSKQNTEEDDSQQTIQNEVIESNLIETPPSLSTCSLKILNGKIDTLSEKETVSLHEKELNIQKTIITPVISNDKSEEHATSNNSKINSDESVSFKSIETPVITSPLKLINVSEIKQIHEEKAISGITPVV